MILIVRPGSGDCERYPRVGQLGEHRRGIARADLCGAPISRTSHAHIVVELHAAALDAVGKEAGDKERDIAGELEFRETLAAVALKSLAIKFGERRSRTGFTWVERDEVIEELHEIDQGLNL